MKDRIIDLLKKMRDENKYNQYKYMALEEAIRRVEKMADEEMDDGK